MLREKGLIFRKKKKKTVKTGVYPRQKSLIKYSTKLKTTLERNENEKHFHFFFPYVDGRKARAVRRNRRLFALISSTSFFYIVVSNSLNIL